MKTNCWEYFKCGREENGANVDELGICPVAIAKKANGINNGTNGGRCCWAIAGTLCNGEVQGGFGQKVMNCLKCEFYKNVFHEEKGGNYKPPAEILKILTPGFAKTK